MNRDYILIVDDDANLRRTLTDILKVKGLFALSVGTAKAALEAVETHPPMVALIDLRLGDMPGLEVLSRIKGCRPDTECIVLTGYATQSSAIEAVNLGAFSYVQKPYEIEQLLVTVQRALEKRRAEQALREREAKLQSIFRAAPIGIGLVADRILLEVNDRICQMLGRSREELIGQSARIAYPSDEEYERVGIVKYGQIREKGTGSIETQWQRKDGAIIDVLLSSTALDPSDLSAGVTFTALDITERKRLEEQLRQAAKMEAVGRLAGGVAHDFNNLLTGILSFSDLLLDSLARDDPRRRDVEEIVSAAKRAASLTNQLLAFSRKQVLQPEMLDLNAFVADTQKLLRRLIGEDIELRTVLDSTLKQVKIDRGQLSQVLINLAVNARDAMPHGGRLIIQTANVVLDEAYARQHLDIQPGPYVLLTISDTGIGMDEEVRSHLFEPFFTTKEVGKGTGLGLSTVYGIVKQSGGEIVVESAPGQGATFKIYLPVATEKKEREEMIPVRPLHGRETILVVEDNEMVRQLACRILRRNGYTVLEAANGSEAIRVCDERSGPVHLLLADVVMPIMGGRQLAAELASRYPTIKVLYMSGYATDVINRQGLLQTDKHYLQKPFTPASLAQKVREILDTSA